jgi:hypothetical protein
VAQARNRKRYLWMVGVVLIIGGLLFWWAASGNQATISAGSAAQKATPVGAKQFDGKYMTFSYSGEYVIKPLQAQPPDLELYMLSADTQYSKQLAVSVTTGSITQDTAYLLRQSQPNVYASHQQVVDGVSATVWVKKDGSEQTIFIPHGNIFALLSFSIAGTNADGQLTPEVNSLLASFQWK